MKTRYVLLTCLLVISGCSTTPLQPTGGSKADGIVEMSSFRGKFSKPEIDTDAALKTAEARCKAWGYESATPFSGVISRCNQHGTMGCAEWVDTIRFQCTGKSEE